MNKREAKIIALDYVINCVCSDEAGGRPLLTHGDMQEDYPDQDLEKIVEEINKVMDWVCGRLRRLEKRG